MPQFDKRTGQIVIRVVYDGAPEAGKTTNLVELTRGISLQRRSELASPGSTTRRTEFFDWVAFTGGFVDGRRLRCQLVSVPGQPSLLRRRKYLLDSADVIVFVADSRAELVETNRTEFERMRKAVARSRSSDRKSVLLQANKQDLSDSLSPPELARAMQLAQEVPVFGASAISGDGVMQTFIAAVRLATINVRELLRARTREELEDFVKESTPEELLGALQRIEQSLAQQELDVSQGAPPVKGAEPRAETERPRDVSSAVSPLDGPAPTKTPLPPNDDGPGDAEAPASVRASATPVAPSVTAPLKVGEPPVSQRESPSIRASRPIGASDGPSTRRYSLAVPAEPSQHPPANASAPAEHADRPIDSSQQHPSLEVVRRPWLQGRDEVAAGHVWPLVDGRSIFAELSGGIVRYPKRAQPWAPRGAIEVRVEDDGRERWVLHTKNEWRFSDRQAAKMALITLVRRLRLLEPWLVPGRAASLQSEGDCLRLWVVTDVMPSLSEVLDRTTLADVRPTLGAVIAASEAAQKLSSIRVDSTCLEAIGVRDVRAWVMALPNQDDSRGTSMSSFERELLDRFSSLPGWGMTQDEVASLLAGLDLDGRVSVAIDAWLRRSRPRPGIVGLEEDVGGGV